MNPQRYPTAEQLHGEYLAGRLTPAAVNEANLASIAQHNPRLNAYVRVDESGSRAAAQDSTDRYGQGAPLGPLDGVTVAVKDNIAVAGLVRPGATVAYKDWHASADAPVVGKLRAAGAIVTGMLNMDEGAFGTTTDNQLYGRCQNPLRHGFTPGGSSGGSGSAVASGLCAVALGTDTLGSVRIPASYCGVVGFKPSHGAINVEGVMALSRTLDHVGILTRTVRDAAIVFDAIADHRLGWQGGDAETGAPDDGLIVGILDTEDLVCADIHASFRNVLNTLEKNGIQSVAIDRADVDINRWRKAGLLIAEAEAAFVHEAALAQNPEGFSASFRQAMAYGCSQSVPRIIKAYETMEDVRQWLAKVFARCHVILSPTTPQKAFSFDIGIQANQSSITSFANLAGVPALALPVDDGTDLPMSIQIVGPFGHDHRLLDIGKYLENLLQTNILENV
jgi:aspartyl-tRNA(Asn)/glutamyl-tRNA(Gln) amidotransferase subunit A